MLSKLKSWYPQFPYKDQEERRSAQIMFVIILAVLAAFMLVIAVSLHRNDWELIWYALGGTVLQVVPLMMLLRGHLYSSSMIAIIGVLVTVTAMATIGQGMHDIAIMSYPVIIIISSLMLERRIFNFISILTIAAIGWLVFGEVSGLYIPRPPEATNWADFLMMGAILLVAIMAVNMLTTNARSNLEQAQREITERKRTEEELQQTQTVVEKAHHDLQLAFVREQHLSRTDALTGVNNRRHWFEIAEHEFKVAARYRRSLALMIFDIDHFKRVNDKYGHMVGDQVIEKVAQVARAALRSSDVIGRYGGEEFVILFPVTTASQAFLVSERIRDRVGELEVETEKGQITVKLSMGIAEMQAPPLKKQLCGGDTLEFLIKRADAALLEVKATGRNRTLIYSPEISLKADTDPPSDSPDN